MQFLYAAPLEIRFILSTIKGRLFQSWAEGKKPHKSESGKDFAERLLDEKYGPENYPKGPKSEFSKIKKWGDRAWE